MLIDAALRDFYQKYNNSDITKLIETSKELGLNHSETFEVADVETSFNTFLEALRGYVEYKIKYKDKSEEAVNQDKINNDMNNFIDHQLVKKKTIRIGEFPNIVATYLTKCKSAKKELTELKHKLILHSQPSNYIQPQDIGYISDYADRFMVVLRDEFYNNMYKMLRVSGVFKDEDEVAKEREIKKDEYADEVIL